ncbi:PEP-utilizing enzyme [Candidatus Accumulibacter sp. ACC012]|uniref:PEP-utilizing enzyme n=1 Tax=Candidatus Accumulibacter sp. ACC012 TaxID=2823332 RepID=UPI003427455A
MQLRDAVCALCLEKRMNVEAAVEEAIKQLMELFGHLEDPYFRERAADLYDVGRRLLDHLAEDGLPDVPAVHEGCCDRHQRNSRLRRCSPGRQGVRGLIVEKGGLTAHATILARSLGIPRSSRCRRRPGNSCGRSGDRRCSGRTRLHQSAGRNPA